MTEAAFLNVYGSPLIQAAAGLMAEPDVVPRHIERDLGRERLQPSSGTRSITGSRRAARTRARFARLSTPAGPTARLTSGAFAC